MIGSREERTQIETAFDRIAVVLTKMNSSLSALYAQGSRHYEHSREAADRREREFEALREAAVSIEKSIALIGSQVLEARRDLDDITNPRANLPAIPAAAENSQSVSRKAVEFIPWGEVIKWGASAGGGALLLRFVQWVIHGG